MFMTMFLYSLKQLLCPYPGDRFFPGRINLSQYQDIRLVEGGKEFLEKVLGTGITVRLK